MAAGLAAVGLTTADVLEPSRSVLPRRKAAGLADRMQFTYRNPERSTDPTRSLAGARSMLVGVLDYRRGEPAASPFRLSARVARYAQVDYYAQLREGLGAMSSLLVDAGHQARVVADSNNLVDRNAAWRAGLGWYGKNSNLLIDGAGSWFVIGAVITDADLGPTSTPVNDGCGGCTACIDDCPTAAIVAPGVLDARRCLAWLVQAGGSIPNEFRAAVGDRIYGCDDCQEVCPPNRVTIRRQAAPAADEGAMAWVDLVHLLEADDAELLAHYGRWYIADRDPDVLRRTALVVLGNTADVADPKVEELLIRYLAHERPVLRAHAVWACRRLGRSDLGEETKHDSDASVRKEWSIEVAAR